MRPLRKIMMRFAFGNSGATSIEYGLIIALAGLWLFAAFGGVGTDMSAGLRSVTVMLERDGEGGPAAFTRLLD